MTEKPTLEELQEADPGSSRPEDNSLIIRLRAGEDSAVVELLDKYHDGSRRFARAYVPDRREAEEVVRDAWGAISRDIQTFDKRTPLKVWIYRKLMQSVEAKMGRDSLPRSHFPTRDLLNEPSVDPGRFYPDGAPGAGHWMMGRGPRHWGERIEARLTIPETRKVVELAIGALSSDEQAVLILRDIEGWSAGETRLLLAIGDSVQRRMLHHGRARVRNALESYLIEGKDV